MSHVSTSLRDAMAAVERQRRDAEMVIIPSRDAASEKQSLEAYRDFVARLNVLGDSEMDRSLRGY